MEIVPLIRAATLTDAAELIALSRLFDGDDAATSDLPSAQTALQNNGTEEIFVAEVSDRIVGFATLQITSSFCSARPTGELTGIFVRPKWRRKGIASRLMRSVVKRCEQVDVLELFLRVNKSNRGAIRFYEHHRFEKARHHEYRLKYYV